MRALVRGLLTPPRVAQEHSVNIKDNPNMLVHVFMFIFNREIDSSSGIGALLTRDMNLVQSNDLRLRVLGRMSNTFTPKSVSNDMCIVLQCLEFAPLQQLQLDMEASSSIHAYDPEEPAFEVQSQLYSRPSLLQIQSNLSAQSRFQHSNAALRLGKRHSEMPCDLPLSQETWGGYSCAQQQVVLFLASVRLDCIHQKESHMGLVVPTKGRLTFASYHTPPNSGTQITGPVSTMLLRVGEAMDLNKLEMCVVARQFAEICFGGVFGNMQIQTMTIVFYVQMYLIAFMHKDTRLQCYFSVVDNFNKRIPHALQHLMLPEYIPHTLTERMHTYSTEHPMPLFVVEQILRPLCV